MSACSVDLTEMRRQLMAPILGVLAPILDELGHFCNHLLPKKRKPLSKKIANRRASPKVGAWLGEFLPSVPTWCSMDEEPKKFRMKSLVQADIVVEKHEAPTVARSSLARPE